MAAESNKIPNMSSCAFCFGGRPYFSDSPGTRHPTHMFLYIHVINVGVVPLPEYRAVLALLHIV